MVKINRNNKDSKNNNKNIRLETKVNVSESFKELREMNKKALRILNNRQY